MATDTRHDGLDRSESRQDSQDAGCESLVAEVLKGLDDLSKKIREAIPGAAAGDIDEEFGAVELTDSGKESQAKDLSPRTGADASVRIGDAGPAQGQGSAGGVDAVKAAAEFEKKGLDGLAEAHKDLKVTKDGSPARVIEFQDAFKVQSDTTPMSLAKEMLGPSATDEQVKEYAVQIKALNKIRGKVSEATLSAGDTIKLPGQTADGGIWERSEGSTYTNWPDGSSLTRTEDGLSSARFEREGAQVEISWNKNNADFTAETVEKGNKQSITSADGTLTEKVKVKRTDADGTYEDWQRVRETQTKNGSSLVREYDKDENLASEIHISSDGRRVVQNLTGGKWDGKTIIEEPDGHKTVIAKDEATGATAGKRMDASGRVVETVAALEGKLVYTDAKTGERRAETFNGPTEASFGYEMKKLGKYDADTGSLSVDIGSVTLVHSFAQGRFDTVLADGSITGITSRGEISFANEKTGEASVVHLDGRGVVLHADGTLDRWGPEARDNAKGEKLTDTELAYMKKHDDIDLRDVAEIHRRFHGQSERIDAFYKQLEKIDDSKNLSKAEKSALRKDLMHHVAAPEEIYQGVTQSCNVTVIERDLAMTAPEKYVSTVVRAISDGTITTADGQEVKLDVKNLKMADASGRDLASRIFQTAALHAEFWPAKNFVNTADGVGRLAPGPDDPRGTKPEVFDGLKPSEIADVRYKLTGEEKAIGYVTTAEEINRAIELNGGVPMTVIVDGGSPPFDGAKSDHSPNHIVTIMGVEQGPPLKYLVANQWGLADDHSTTHTAILASDLVKNMTTLRNEGGEPYTGAGMVITAGDHDKVYDIWPNGKRDNPTATASHAETNRTRKKPAGTPQK